MDSSAPRVDSVIDVKRAWLPIVGLLVVFSVTMPAGASHSWGNYHWPRAENPVTIPIVDSVVGDWDIYLGQVRTDWDVSAVLALPLETGASSSKDRKRCTPILGKIRACNASYGRNGWLGLAQIWLYSGTSHIAQGTAKVNDSYFSLSYYNDANAKRHVLCQEVGHDFGLGHYHGASCMDDDSGLFSASYVDPAQHDYDQLDTIYGGHVDSTFTAPSGGGQGNGSGRSSVHVARDGIYTRVTVILWATR